MYSTADAMVYRATLSQDQCSYYRRHQTQAKISFVMWQHPIHIHLTQTFYSVQISLLVYCITHYIF
ncbi:hypothetical protein F6P92_04365 [Streptococcus suis]|nr:hypothetical protein [Streptococcus suis]MBS8077563.1 hypothetical protein [Streptococcus suis]RRN52601.1 hypothetical protein EI218_10010 [Streptococcus suis]